MKHSPYALIVLTTLLLAGCLTDEKDPRVPGGSVDTLRNHAASAGLYLPRYSATEGLNRGLVLGQNFPAGSQQYAEKYFIQGAGSVSGVIFHAGGTSVNPANEIEIAVWTVALNGLPGRKIGSKRRAYGDLDLTGAAQYIAFDAPLAVTDSFFVSFDLGDYLHGGFEGDTLGLYACTEGCRNAQDLDLYGRNVVQRHNHARVDWRDFYWQNNTPLTIHLALYPSGDLPR